MMKTKFGRIPVIIVMLVTVLCMVAGLVACKNPEDGNPSIPTACEHKLEKTDAVEAVCEQEGNYTYWTCSKCGKYFSDEDGKTEIDENDWVIDALNHDYGEPVWDWTEYTSATATFTCKNDKNKTHVEIKNAEITDETNRTQCTVEVVYTATVLFNNEEYTDVKTNASGSHTFGEWIEEPATCVEDGIKGHFHCEVCGKDFDEDQVTEIGNLTIPKSGHHINNGVCTNCDFELIVLTEATLKEEDGELNLTFIGRSDVENVRLYIGTNDNTANYHTVNVEGGEFSVAIDLFSLAITGEWYNVRFYFDDYDFYTVRYDTVKNAEGQSLTTKDVFYGSDRKVSVRSWDGNNNFSLQVDAYNSTTEVTATEVKFEDGYIVFNGSAGGAVETLVAYLYNTDEKIDTYSAAVQIEDDMTFTVKIGLKQLTANPWNWYYLMVSVNGGEKTKVVYTDYDHDDAHRYGSRVYKWNYSEGIAVYYYDRAFNIDIYGVRVFAEKDGHVYLSVSGTYEGVHSEDEFDMDIQLQGGDWGIFKRDVVATRNGNAYTITMDITEASANSAYYSIHVFANGVSKNVACKDDPWHVETSATTDSKIYKLNYAYAGWGDDQYIITITIEASNGKFTQVDYLKVNGTEVRKNYGNGDTVMLRGTNAGGYFVGEEWMISMGAKDYKTASQVLADRFGEETMQELWAYYRSYFWNDQDFKNCADMGMTAIRLPFTYMNVDYKQDGNYDFAALDDFVRGAAKYGIYTILDLHGAYGSQNGMDHSGEEIESDTDVDFYSNEEKKAKTVALWEALARHYLGNPAIAAFDLLNEPGIKNGTTDWWHYDYYDVLYKAIRAIDGDRIIIFESCWSGANLPHPSERRWENCMYSFHHYTNMGDSQPHLESFEDRLAEVAGRNFGVPVYMGEFTAYSNEESWVKTLELMNEYGWHWTSWTYKTSWDLGGWGIYCASAEKPDLENDSIDELKNKWRGNSSRWAKASTLVSGKLIKDVIKEALTG